MAAQADAATTKVQIVQKTKPNAFGLDEIALSVNSSTFFVGAKGKYHAGIRRRLTSYLPRKEFSRESRLEGRP
jgi:hypothetical protein